MKDIMNLFAACLIFLLMIVGTWVVVTLPYYLIWNLLLVSILALSVLNFLECMALSFLINMMYATYVMAYDSKKVSDKEDI